MECSLWRPYWTKKRTLDEVRPNIPFQEEGREQVKKNLEKSKYQDFAIGL